MSMCACGHAWFIPLHYSALGPRNYFEFNVRVLRFFSFVNELTHILTFKDFIAKHQYLVDGEMLGR